MKPFVQKPRPAGGRALAAGASGLLLSLSALVAMPALAAEPGAAASEAADPRLPRGAEVAARLPTQRFVYKAVNVPLADLLRDFAGAIDRPLFVADGVTGTANSNFNLSPKAFLDLISRAFGLVWFHDSSGLYVYPSNQIQTRTYRMDGVTPSQLTQRLAALGAVDGRYPLRFVQGQTLVIVVGPPRLFELIDAAFDTLRDEDWMTGALVTRTVALRHASATDRDVQGTRIPGIATVLAQVFLPRQEASPGLGGMALSGMAELAEVPNTLPRTMRGRDNRTETAREVARTLQRGGAPATPSAPRPTGPGVQVNRSQDPAQERRLSETPSITPHEGTNAVVLRLPRDELKAALALIERMDVPVPMIEIEASIIEVSSDEIRNLGVDWQYRSSSVAADSRFDTGSAGSNPLAPEGSFSLSTVISGRGMELLSRIRVLESRGTARITAQPRVLGAANRTAVLSDKRSASVRVAGNQDARLYAVEAGTTMQVLPRVITTDGTTRIALSLQIEDGGFSAQSVDAVPIVNRTTIATEVVLTEGQSLLVGGIVVETQNDGRTGVPGLSRLPWVGGIFRSDETRQSNRQRLFLITPRRVPADGSAAVPPATPMSGPGEAGAPMPMPGPKPASRPPADPARATEEGWSGG